MPNNPPDIRSFFQNTDPQTPALLNAAGRLWTYAGLAALAEEHRLALAHAGIGKGDRVATLTRNGPEAAISFLTVCCSAVAAPLNPAYGERELDFYLTDLRPKAVLVSSDLDSPVRRVAERLGLPLLELEPETMKLRGGSTPQDPPEWAGADDTALLLHTSGTTSRPKLVPLTHRNLCASARNVAATLQLNGADRCLNIMPLFHIHGLVGAILSSLSAGASIVCAPGLDVGAFFRWIEELEPTWYTAVPTMHQSILSRFAPSRNRLRLIRSSSASLPPTVMAGLEEAFGVPVIESYGMTEASHQMASNPLPPAARKPGSVGIPAGPEIRILDGEVCIRGENVTAGYETNPEANSAAYSDGWFRTGDQGYFDADGYLFLTGRLKELINRGGEKIAPREIDEALLEHPDVQQAVAFAVPHTRLGEDVGVAVVPRAGAMPAERDLIEFCAARLADFKVPRVVKLVPEIPKGPTGKLMRIGLAKALGIAEIGAAAATAASGRAPRTETERALQSVWSDVLRVPPPDPEAGFFDLGGDSLLAAQVVFRVEESLGAKLPLVLFRTAPTIAGMAEALDRSRAARTKGVADGLVAIREGEGPPLFWIAGHDGELLGITNLAQHLPGGFPIYAFEPPRGGTLLSVEDLAGRYLAVARAQQPEGPYRLAGFCTGGLVALALAGQLESEGDEPELLTLIECFNPRWFERQPAPRRWIVSARHLARRLLFHAEQCATAPSALHYLKSRWGAVAKQRAEQSAQARYEAAILDGHRPAGEQWIANRAAASRYEPRPYGGPVLLVAPSHPRRRRFPDAMLGWQDVLTGPVRLCSVPDRMAGLLVEPAVRTAAAALREALARQPVKV